MGTRAISMAALVAVAGVSVVALELPAAASDQSVAETLVVTAADAGPGFSTGTVKPADPEGFGRLADCVGKPQPKRKMTATAQSVALIDTSNGNIVLSTVDIVSTKAQLTADRKVFQSPKIPGCIKKLAETALPAGGKVLSVTPRNARALRRVFGDSLAYVVRIEVEMADGSNVEVLDMGFAKGRAEIDAQIQSARTGIDIAGFAIVVAPMLQRLEHAKL